MSDQSDQQWRNQHQYYENSMPLLPDWQQNQVEQLPGLQDTFSPDAHGYAPYSGGPAPNWPSDIDMGTPSSAGFAIDSADTFQPTQPFGQLQVPANAVGTHSPQSSHSGISPHTTTAGLAPERPSYGRSLTDPGQKRRATAPAAPGIKQQSSDEEDDAVEEAARTCGGSSGKGRKRQRIPHTAVERRYRENLNAHLEKLRQTVPSLALRNKGEGGGGVKPSKCEILSGAIDHIGAIDRENAALKGEVAALRQKVGELEGWYRR